MTLDTDNLSEDQKRALADGDLNIKYINPSEGIDGVVSGSQEHPVKTE